MFILLGQVTRLFQTALHTPSPELSTAKLEWGGED